MLPLKGPLLAQMLYGSPGLRQSGDLDLLVRRKDFERAQVLLKDLGFQPLSPADFYHQEFKRGNTWVELHFSVTPPTPIRAWTCARAGSVRRRSNLEDRRLDLLPNQIYSCI